jgi:hypothetical protein
MGESKTAEWCALHRATGAGASLATKESDYCGQVRLRRSCFVSVFLWLFASDWRGLHLRMLLALVNRISPTNIRVLQTSKYSVKLASIANPRKLR